MAWWKDSICTEMKTRKGQVNMITSWALFRHQYSHQYGHHLEVNMVKGRSPWGHNKEKEITQDLDDIWLMERGKMRQWQSAEKEKKDTVQQRQHKNDMQKWRTENNKMHKKSKDISVVMISVWFSSLMDRVNSMEAWLKYIFLLPFHHHL